MKIKAVFNITMIAVTALTALLVACAAPKSAITASDDADPMTNMSAASDTDGFESSAYDAAGSTDADKPAVSKSAAAKAAAAAVKGMTVEDSLADEQYREEEGQDFSSLFDASDPNNHMEIDTLFAWSNSKINSGRFDYKALGSEDTIRIPLVDSAQGKHFVHPFPGVVTSPFGPRRYLWHYGMDVKLQRGDTLKTILDGIVRVIQYDRRGYGNVVVVRHHSGIETVYGHLSKVKVETNQRLKAGDMVGLGGNTGRSTGAHLHFEIRYFGEPFDPRHIINFDPPYELKSDTLVLTKENFEYLTEVRKTVTHTIRSGDNLGSIARRYGTTVNNLCRLNGITPRTTLRIGRRLVVRSGKEAEKQVVTQTRATTDIVPDGGALDAEADTDADDIDMQ